MKIVISQINALSSSKTTIIAWLPIDQELLARSEIESPDELDSENGWIFSTVNSHSSPAGQSSRKQLSFEEVELLKAIASKVHLSGLREAVDSYRSCDGGSSEVLLDYYDFSVSIKLKFMLPLARDIPSFRGLSELWAKMEQLAFQ